MILIWSTHFKPYIISDLLNLSSVHYSSTALWFRFQGIRNFRYTILVRDFKIIILQIIHFSRGPHKFTHTARGAVELATPNLELN